MYEFREGKSLKNTDLRLISSIIVLIFRICDTMYDRQEPGANQDPEQLLLDHVNIHLPSTLQCEEIFTFS